MTDFSWLPTDRTYTDQDLPMHPSMIVVSNSEQKFGKWSRRLITMEKTKKYCEAVDDQKKLETGHSQFREKYFNKFR